MKKVIDMIFPKIITINIFKDVQASLLVVFVMTSYLSGNSQTTTENGNQTEIKETLNEVSTIGYFDGKVINKYGYKINEYYISISDLSTSQIEAIKGKMIKVSGKLFISETGNSFGFQRSNEVTKYIKQPKIVLHQELDSNEIVQENSTSDNSLKHNYTVRVVGAMRNVMHKGELFGTIQLDTISNFNHLYGLGPVEYLKGEILVLDGKTYISSVVNDTKMQVIENSKIKAPFFVSANVDQWNEVDFPDSIQTIPQLEVYLDNISKSQQRPFPFKITATVQSGDIHIVNLPEGTEVHSPEEAHQEQKNYPLENEQAEMIGFFSTEHQGVFTHHDSFVHIHLITTDKLKMGHLDEVKLKKGTAKLFLPK